MPERTLLFDVETTGKADFKAPAPAVHQPRIVQLAAILVEGEDVELASLNVIIEPDGFLIPSDASAIHGITTARAEEVGVPITMALEIFQALICKADWIVGHNIPFDILCAQVEFHRRSYADPFVDKPTFCTMRNATDICCIPGPYGFKWPRLGEAYQFAFNERLENAHNAMNDLRATLRLYNWLKNKMAERTLSGVR